MKVLVTGANGFVGRYVVSSFIRQGHEVRALVRPSASIDSLEWRRQVEIARGDLRVSAGLELACDGVDAVVHLGARMGGSEAQQFETTVVGTERLLQAVGAKGARRVVLASSFAVYDWSAINGRLTEDSPTAALNSPRRGPYTVAKLWQELVTRRMAERHAFELAVLRPGFVWGRDHAVLSGMGQRYGGVYVVFGRSTLLPLTYVENCADAFVAATIEGAAEGQTFNVVDDEPITTRRYTVEYLRGAGVRGRVVSVPYGVALAASRVGSVAGARLFGEKRDLPDVLVPERLEAQFKPLRFPNTRIKTGLGWTPALGFEDALIRTYGR